MAAITGSSPIERCRLMFSSTTMESSTSTPMPSDRPSRLSVLSVKPNIYIGPNVAIMETGMAMATMIVPRGLCRKMKTTRTAIRAPIIREATTSLTLSWTCSDWSVVIVKVTSGGTSLATDLSCCLTLSAAATVLPPVVFRMSMPTAGTPFTSEDWVACDPVSTTCAMSLRLTVIGPPLAPEAPPADAAPEALPPLPAVSPAALPGVRVSRRLRISSTLANSPIRRTL